LAPILKLTSGQNAAAAAEDINQTGTPTTSDSSTYSYSSQLSTWDMRTLPGPITTASATASSDKPTAAAAAAAAAATKDSQVPVAETPLHSTAVSPLPPPLASLHGSLPSFSQRMRSPSILGTPALDTPLAPAPASPTEHLTVTRVGDCTLVNQYLVVQYLGRGTSGKVYLCIDVLDRRLYAVKIVRKTPREGDGREDKRERDDKEEIGEEEGGVEETSAESAGGDSASAAGGAGSEEVKSALDDQKEGNKEEDIVDQPVSLPSLPFPTSSNEKEQEHIDKYAAKALRMKQKVALRNSKSPSVFSAGTQQSSSSSTHKKLKRKSHRDPLIDLQREVDILRSVGSNHPNVVTLREIVDDPTSHKMLIVMEYCEGGPVMTRAGLERGRRIPECVARPYFRDMIAALGHLHRNRIIHGDLKPENALMNANGRISLSDFGCSKILPPPLPPPPLQPSAVDPAANLNLQNDLIDRCNGTPAFLAPEMMTPGAKFRGQPADVYSLGTCLFTFIFGKIPFAADSVFELFKIVKTQKLSFPDIPANASTEVKALLDGLLAKDPEKRMTLEKAAAHEWTTDNGRLPPVSVPEENTLSNLNSSNKRSSNFKTPHTTPTLNSTTIPLEDPHILDGDASLAGLLTTPGVEIQTFLPCQVLLRQGDRSTSIMYILKGDVDVLYRPSEEVMKGVQQVDAITEKDGNKDKSDQGDETLKGSIKSGGGSGGVGGAITKLWSPPSRVKRTAPSIPPPTPSTTTAIPSLDLIRATTLRNSTGSVSEMPSEMLSAQNATGTAAPRTTRAAPALSGRQPSGGGGFISPREHSLMLGLGTTPEPSPRVPIHSTATSTGALSSSFQLHQGLVSGFGGGAGAGSSYSIDSAVTTPASTPLPSARENENGPPQNIGMSAVNGDGEKEKNKNIEEEPTPSFIPVVDPVNRLPSVKDAIKDRTQTFSTPATVLSSLPPSHTPAEGEAAVAESPATTPGSDDGSKLAAYPLQLTSNDLAGSGDLDSSEDAKSTVEINLVAKSIAGTAGKAPSSPSRVLNTSRSSSAPIPTIIEEGETVQMATEVYPSTSKENGTGIGGSCSVGGSGDEGSIKSGIGLIRPESSGSWALQAQFSGNFSAQSKQLTLGSDTEVLGMDENSKEKNSKGHINVDESCDRTDVAGFNASSSTSIPCALAKAAEEALGSIKSLYRDTDSYARNRNSSSAGAYDGSVGKSDKDTTCNSNSSVGRSTSGEFLLAVRSAGDFIGETALIEGSSVRRSCSVRASVPHTGAIGADATDTSSPSHNQSILDAKVKTHTDNVTGDYDATDNGVQVAVIPYSAAKQYLKTHPLAKQRLAEMVWLRQSETIVLEGLLRLAAISEELNEEARIEVEKGIESS